MEYIEVRKQLIGAGSLPLQCGLHGPTPSHHAGCVSDLNPEPSHQTAGKLLKTVFMLPFQYTLMNPCVA